MDVDWLGLYLLEDLGPGDATSNAVVPASATGRARIVARERLLVAGVGYACEVFGRLGATAIAKAKDGAWVKAGAVLVEVSGPSRAILSAERVSLNLLARMSGIATQTRILADALKARGSEAKVAGTRKTTPGFRFFEKDAIRIGGGEPHRMGLWDAAMVKDNHIAAVGSAKSAVEAVRRTRPDLVVTCEVESKADALAAAAAGVHWLLIDNQTAAVGKAWAKEVAARFPEVRFEASGGITPKNIGRYGWANRISLGWLTQKAPAADVSLEWVANK